MLQILSYSLASDLRVLVPLQQAPNGAVIFLLLIMRFLSTLLAERYASRLEKYLMNWLAWSAILPLKSQKTVLRYYVINRIITFKG